MQESQSARAIVHFLGGETLAVPPNQVEHLLAAVGKERMTQLQVGTRVTWVNPNQVAYIQMPSVAVQPSGDGNASVPRIDAMHAVPRLKVG